MGTEALTLVKNVIDNFSKVQRLKFLMGSTPFHSYKHFSELTERLQENLTTAAGSKKSYIKKQIKKTEEKIQEIISNAENEYNLSAADFIEIAEFNKKNGREVFSLLMTKQEQPAA